MHAAWKILSGQTIYIDFYENHHPFFYYLLVPVIGMFKEGVVVLFASRALVFLILLLILAVTYHISRIIFCEESAVISLVLLSGANVFIIKAIEIRPDVPQTLFGLLSLSLLFSYFEKLSFKYLILSSISLAVSFLFLQKTIFLAAFAGVLLLLSAGTGEIKFKDVLLFAAFFLALLLPYFLYLTMTHQLQAYFLYNWAMNTGFFQTDPLRMARGVSFLITSFGNNPMLWICWLLSLLFLKTSNQQRLGALTFFLIIIFISIQYFYSQYLMVVIPLIAVMAGYAVHQVIKLFFEKKSCVLLILLIVYMIFPLHSYIRTMIKRSNAYQFKKIEYVLSITRPEDYVFDEHSSFNLFRKDPGFFWFSLGDYIGPSPGLGDNHSYHYQYDLYQLLDQYKPKIISFYKVRKLEDQRILKDYKESGQYDGLYIRKTP